MKPHYSEEEANAILHRAIERMPMKGEMTREQLENIAGEIGITPDALRRAEQEQVAEGGRQEQYAQFLAHERGVFKSALYSFIGVNTFLMFINYNTAWGFKWFVFPLLGMGLGLYKTWVRSCVRDTQEHIDAYNHWLRDHQPRELPPWDVSPPSVR